MNYVYLIYDVGNKLTKIGRSNNPIKRLCDLKTSNSKLKLIWFGSEYQEKELHNIYDAKRIFGEWFMLSKEDYLDITKNKKYIPHSLFCNSIRNVKIINNKTLKENQMLQEIKSKWILKYKNWNLCITQDKKVYDIDSKIQLIEYWNNGTISYRLPRTTKKIGKKTINKYSVKREIIIQHYIPF